jgi:hypothetical protein
MTLAPGCLRVRPRRCGLDPHRRDSSIRTAYATRFGTACRLSEPKVRRSDRPVIRPSHDRIRKSPRLGSTGPRARLWKRSAQTTPSTSAAGSHVLSCKRMLHLRPVMAMPDEGAIWPAVESKSPATAFSERAPLRKLVAVVDAELLDAVTDDADDDLGPLAGLLSHPYVTMLRYADGGPPEDARRIDPSLGPRAAAGWIEVGPENEPYRMFPVVSCDGATIRETGIIGDLVPAAEHDDTSGAYKDLEPEQAAARRRADAIAMCAAATSGAHMFITRRDYLHRVTWDLSQGVLAARPEDALDLIALYLRAQGVFEWWRSIDGTGVESVNRGLFYAYGAQTLLPGWWRWRNAIGRHVDHTMVAHKHHVDEDRELRSLAIAPLTRLQRALEARDQVHRALNQPQHGDTAEQVLASLDIVLLMLMAALDATALVADRVLKLNSPRSAGWQRKGWLKQVRKADSDLADAFARDSTWNGAVLLVLSRLRNSIHGAASAPLGLRTPVPGQSDTLIEFPQVDADELAKYLARLGGAARWGMRIVVHDRVHFDPDGLLENLFAAAVKVIDNTMVATPVEQLDGVVLTDELSHTPEPRPVQTCIRRLLAVGDPPPDTRHDG